MNNEQIIENFYKSFAAGDYQGMIKHYHADVVFNDPAFGTLSAKKAIKMWEMLLSNKEAAPQISFSNIKADNTQGSVDWKAEYFFGPKKRKVVNQIHANFSFQDGKIIKHTDDFSVWKWSSQALGLTGSILGWTPMVKSKIQKMANGKLAKFMEI